MQAKLPAGLQLCPFSPALEQGLAQRLDCLPWFAMSDGERRAWLADHAADARVAVTGGHVGCPVELMQALPSLGLVAINGVGFDKVDLTLARERGIAVTNTPDVLTEDVADLAIGLIIALLRQIPRADRFVRDGSWGTAEWPLGRKVTGSRFGVLGLGRIGQAIADRLAPFGEVAYCGRSEKAGDLRYFVRPRELAEWCDVLVVACAATAQTANLVDAEVIAALGERGWLVNVARGSVVDERALAAAIADGCLAGAALDVFAAEPVVPEALMRSERTVLTPHIASGTHETRGAMAELVLGNIDAFLAGEPLRTPVA